MVVTLDSIDSILFEIETAKPVITANYYVYSMYGSVRSDSDTGVLVCIAFPSVSRHSSAHLKGTAESDVNTNG